MSKKIILIVFILFRLNLYAQDTIPVSPVLSAHPRLLLAKQEETRITNAMKDDPVLRNVHQQIILACDSMLNYPPVARIKIGIRLLDKSREALRRIFYLSYAWRFTKDRRYLQKAESELMAISNFQDWNPEHFLDVAEMTLAASIGYDWLFDDLSLKTRQLLRQAIIEKGLKPAMESRYTSWLNANTNWNQVCNTGVALGALSVYEDAPELSRTIINRSIRSIVQPLKQYSPDGAYPEGYSYWAYGTGFNVIFFDVLEKNFNINFRSAAAADFLKTPYYLQNMTGALGTPFNYSDSGGGQELQPAMFWFAERLNDPSLTWVERKNLKSMPAKNIIKERLLPAILIWGCRQNPNPIPVPAKRIWAGNGPSPVALMRSSWTDTNAVFLGLKCGTPNVNHGHMDVGSFVLDMDGERWAMDLGSENYTKLESYFGLKIWSEAQDSPRWQVLRYQNKAHNTLSVNDDLQQVNGYAAIKRYADAPGFLNAQSDLSSIYKGRLKSALRGAGIIDNDQVVIRDEIQASDDRVSVKWTMVTDAQIEIDHSKVKLTKNGKQLFMDVLLPCRFKIQGSPAYSAQAYDSSNGNAKLLTITFDLEPQERCAINVLFHRGKKPQLTKNVGLPLNRWPGIATQAML